MLIWGNVPRLHVASRVVSTKLTEEEHSKIMEMCKESQTILSTFLKQCIMELVEKEENKIEKPVEATPTPEFSLINEKNCTNRKQSHSPD